MGWESPGRGTEWTDGSVQQRRGRTTNGSTGFSIERGEGALIGREGSAGSSPLAEGGSCRGRDSAGGWEKRLGQVGRRRLKR